MTIVYTLTSELRTKLKDPFGELIEGTFEYTMSKLKESIAKDSPPRIITVGDVVSQNLHEYKFKPQLSIIDNISLRTQIMPKTTDAKNTVNVINPQGTITKEAIIAIKKALEEKRHTHIIIQGEEDLLVLIAVLYASDGDLVVYGQPHQGIVVIKVSEEKKTQVKKLLKSMKPSKS